VFRVRCTTLLQNVAVDSQRCRFGCFCRECKPSRRVEVQCSSCLTHFSIYESQQEKNSTGRFFCSSSCARGANSRGAVRRGFTKACEREGCDRTFYVAPSEAERKKFCSQDCRKNRVDKICRQCGAPFWIRASHAGTGAFCSTRCASIGKMKNAIKGEYFNDRPKRWHSGVGGYVQVYAPNDPSSHKDGWAFEHRIIAAETAGRALLPGEEVDHVNQIKFDNRPENLALVNKTDHAKKTSQDAVANRLANRRRLEILDLLIARFPAVLRSQVLQVASVEDLVLLDLEQPASLPQDEDLTELETLLIARWCRLGMDAGDASRLIEQRRQGSLAT
jgi:HNH endonuclease